MWKGNCKQSFGHKAIQKDADILFGRHARREKSICFANPQTLIHHFLEKSAQSFPSKIALIQEKLRATYAQLNSQANQLAHFLLNEGITRGDRVVLILENCPEYVISYYAILKAGAVAVPLSTELKPEGLRPLLEELGPRIIISSYRFERLLKAIELSTSGIQALIVKSSKLQWTSEACSIFQLEDLIGSDCLSNPNIPIEETALASIIYTSGSTGKPRGVMLSHKNIVANTHSICQYLHLTDSDIQMVVLPFFYVMGKSLLNTHFAVGATVVINNKFAYPASVIKQMVEERVTSFSGVPSTYAYLLHRSPFASYRDKLDSLRYCSQAGGHMSRQIKEQLRNVLPRHTQVYIMYGATEASARLTYLDPESFAYKMDSIGKPIPGVSLKVVDDKGQVIPPGKTGEIVAVGSNIMQGYWKDPRATAKVLDENGYHTGDLGYCDNDGYFFVVGRKDHLLKVGGHRINPQEIEDVLMKSELLMEVIVSGVPDALLGYKLVALVAPKTNACSENVILNHCAEMLPRYKVPGYVKFIKALPKSASGKINRTLCLELLNKDGI